MLAIGGQGDLWRSADAADRARPACVLVSSVLRFPRSGRLAGSTCGGSVWAYALTMPRRSVGVLPLLALLIGCPADERPRGAVNERGRGSTDPDAEAKAEAASDTARALGRMHRLNRVVVKLGEYAKQMGSSGEVRAYADRLVRDHEHNDDRVEAVARQLDIEPVVPEPPPETKARVERIKRDLVRSGGVEFDRRFLKTMAAIHEKSIAHLRNAQPDVEKPLAELIERSVPMLERHLAEARELLADLPEA